MATGRLYPQKDGVDESSYSYASTTDFVEFKGPNQYIQLLAGAAAPSTAHNNAPLGSIYIATGTGAVKVYVKTAASTWTVVGSQS
jgi:hypothetical protein